MSDMAIHYERRPISVDDLTRMEAAGIFDPDERVELLDGEIITVPPMNPPHAGGITAITRLLTMRFNDVAYVRVQVSLPLGPFSQPLRDFALTGLDANEWRSRDPRPDEVLLVIEVAESSRNVDLYKKAPLYARAGIADFWVVDLIERRLVVHREPLGESYALTRILQAHETIAPLAFPDARFDVAALTGRDIGT